MDINGKKVRGIYFGNNIIVDGSELPPAPPAVDKTKAPLKSLIGNNSPTQAIVQETFTLTRGWYYVELAGCGGGGGSIAQSFMYTSPTNAITHDADCTGGYGGFYRFTLPVFTSLTITLSVGTPGQGGTSTKAGDGGKSAIYFEEFAQDKDFLDLYHTVNPNGSLYGGAYGGLADRHMIGVYTHGPKTNNEDFCIASQKLEHIAPGGSAFGIGGGNGGGGAVHMTVGGAMYIEASNINNYHCLVACGGAGGGCGKAMNGYSSFTNANKAGVGFSGGGGAFVTGRAAITDNEYICAGGGGGGSTILYINEDYYFVAGGGGGGGSMSAMFYPPHGIILQTRTLRGKHGSNNGLKFSEPGGGGLGGTKGAKGGAGWAKIWKLT